GAASISRNAGSSMFSNSTVWVLVYWSTFDRSETCCDGDRSMCAALKWTTNGSRTASASPGHDAGGGWAASPPEPVLSGGGMFIPSPPSFDGVVVLVVEVAVVAGGGALLLSSATTTLPFMSGCRAQ